MRDIMPERNYFVWMTKLNKKWDNYTTKAIELLKKEGYNIDKYGDSKYGYLKWVIEFFVRYVEKRFGVKIVEDAEMEIERIDTTPETEGEVYVEGQGE